MEDSLDVLHKLNFFQKIRKNLYLRNMTVVKAQKYDKLPDYLKSDMEVMLNVCKKSGQMINSLSHENVKKVITQMPGLVNQMLYEGIERVVSEEHGVINSIEASDISGMSTISSILDSMPEVMENIESRGTILNLLFNPNVKCGNEAVFSHLSPDMQMELLTQERIKYEEILPDDESKTSEITSDVLGDLPIELFNFENVLKTAIAEHKKFEDKVKELKDELRKAHEMGMRSGESEIEVPTYESGLTKFNLSKLPIKEQLKLSLVSPEYLAYLSDEAIEKYVDNNPFVLEEVPYKAQLRYAEKHPEIYKNLPARLQGRLGEEFRNKENIKVPLTNTVDTPFQLQNFNLEDYGNIDEAKRKLIILGHGSNEKVDFVLNNIAECTNEEYICEIAKFEPEVFSHIKEIERLKKYVADISPEGAIKNYILSSDIHNKEVVDNLAKFLVNEDIMQKVPQDMLLKCAKNPQHGELEKIVKMAFGEKAGGIIADRPGLDIRHIGNFAMFNSDIIQEFGEGAIHAVLSARSSVLAEFAELAGNPKRFEEYKRFNELFGRIFGDSAVGLEEKMRAFEMSCDLLRNCPDLEHLELEEQILVHNNIHTAFIDSLNSPDHIVKDFPNTMEELKSYIQDRNNVYDTAIKRVNNSERLKSLMSKRFFGMEARGEKQELLEFDVWDMVNIYDLENFTDSKETAKYWDGLKEELDDLEILTIFSKIQRPEVLRELSDVMRKDPNLFAGPVRYNSLQTKVRDTYAKEITDSFITPKKAMEMIKEGREGISVREENGVKIINLEGIDFTAYVSNIETTNNEKLGYLHLDKHNIADYWRELEDGVNTISGCVINQDETGWLTLGAEEKKPNVIGVGFGSMNSNQIVGMGPTDIMVEHKTRMLKPQTMFERQGRCRYSYSKNFINKTREFIKSGRDPLHKYNEMAINRRSTNLSEVRRGTYGGKLMPEYIYVNKDIEAGVELAKQFGVEYVFAYNEEAYKDRSRDMSKEDVDKTQEVKREETHYMRSVRDVARGGFGDEGR